jgi:hypothetical protein
MGQYQQWLHYQEVDQQLRLRLEQLETELTHLQEPAPGVEEVTPSPSDNVIVQALLAYHSAETASADVIGVPDTQEIPILPEQLPISETSEEALSTHHIPAEPLSAPVSPALLAWSRLYLDSQKMPVPSLNTNRPTPSPSSAEGDLLPEDMATFLSRHAPTVPQSKLPGWLENAISTSTVPEQLPNNPVDQQTLRTNRLIERWLERWRKTSPSSQEQQEDESHR